MIERELKTFLKSGDAAVVDTYDEALSIALDAGTSEGVKKAWEKRHRKALADHFKDKHNSWQINLAKGVHGMTPAELKKSLTDMWFEEGLDPKEGEKFPDVSIEMRQKGAKRFSSENGNLSAKDYPKGNKVYHPEYGEGHVDDVIGPDGDQIVMASFRSSPGKLYKFGTQGVDFTLPLSKLKKI